MCRVRVIVAMVVAPKNKRHTLNQPYFDMQGSEAPQAAVCRFVGKAASKAHKDAFYQRLKATPAANLPSSCTTASVTLQNALGKVLGK